MFIPQTGTPVKDPTIRRQMKQQVMQHVGRRRRKADLIRRQPILQYSLNVLDTFLVDASVTNSLSKSIPYVRGNEEDATRLDTTSFMEELRCGSADPRALASERLSFDRLGAGLLDPFIRYPFRLDDRARELMCAVYGAKSGPVSPFKVLAFRVIWVEVSIMDAAAFHQFLAGAQAYFDFLRTAQLRSSLPKSSLIVLLRSVSLTPKLQMLRLQVLMELSRLLFFLPATMSVLQMIGDFEKWRMHMLGLKEIIRIRGDIDASGMNELLRHMLSK
ncbi:hypothetical protein CJF31_00012014 [Rutstroemia sp. NJR-2017a BVV2]|nr:hypothetical protein CJF31_00012014 [Rutstroemia sp. NJR-2017a BVV2]